MCRITNCLCDAILTMYRVIADCTTLSDTKKTGSYFTRLADDPSHAKLGSYSALFMFETCLISADEEHGVCSGSTRFAIQPSVVGTLICI